MYFLHVQRSLDHYSLSATLLVNYIKLSLSGALNSSESMFELESCFTGIEHYNDDVEALVVSLAYEIKVLQANNAVPYVHQLMTNCSNLAKPLNNYSEQNVFLKVY